MIITTIKIVVFVTLLVLKILDSNELKKIKSKMAPISGRFLIFGM